MILEHLQQHPEPHTFVQRTLLIEEETMRVSMRLNLMCSDDTHWPRKDKTPSNRRVPGLLSGVLVGTIATTLWRL